MNEEAPALARMTPDDVEAVSALARVVWQATYPSLISQAQIDAMLADRYSPTVMREQLDDPGHAWWVTHEDGQPVAFAHALRDAMGCKIDKLYVHPARQHRGLGAALVRAVESWARANHIDRLWLQVNRGNTQAIRAYEKYGFRIVASRVFDIGNGYVMDDHIMEKTL